MIQHPTRFPFLALRMSTHLGRFVLLCYVQVNKNTTVEMLINDITFRGRGIRQKVIWWKGVSL